MLSKLQAESMSKGDLWNLAQVAISCMPGFVTHPARLSSPHGLRWQPQSPPARGRSAASVRNIGCPHRLPHPRCPRLQLSHVCQQLNPELATKASQNTQSDWIFPFFAKMQKICCMSGVPSADAFSTSQVSSSALGTARPTGTVRPREERLPCTSLVTAVTTGQLQAWEHTPAPEQHPRARPPRRTNQPPLSQDCCNR